MIRKVEYIINMVDFFDLFFANILTIFLTGFFYFVYRLYFWYKDYKQMCLVRDQMQQLTKIFMLFGGATGIIHLFEAVFDTRDRVRVFQNNRNDVLDKLNKTETLDLLKSIESELKKSKCTKSLRSSLGASDTTEPHKI